MFLTLVILIALAMMMIAYLAIFRAEGLLAFYMLGVFEVFLVVGLLRIPWSTAMTGAVFPIIFFPCILWWILAKKDPTEPQLPRRIGAPVILIFSLALFWQIKHFYEAQFLSPRSSYEYYKWMYLIARWIAPFLLGVMFPMTLKRLRRFLLAATVLAVVMAVTVIVSYLVGQRDFADSYGMRYSPVERLGPLGISVYAGVGAACVMGYILMKSRLKERLFFANFGGWLIVALLIFAILLSGSRGPFISVVLTLIIALFLLGGRAAVRIAIGMIIAGVLLITAVTFLPEGPIHRILGEGMIFGKGGIGYRWHLFVTSFNILNKHPVIGQTLQLAHIIELDYSHQIITQVMVETGLLGMVAFLIALVPTLVKWTAASLRRKTDLGVFAGPIMVLLVFTLIQRNIAGELSALEFWLFLGIAMGHRLRVQPQAAYEDYLEIEGSLQSGYALPLAH